MFGYLNSKQYSQEWTQTIKGILESKGKPGKIKDGMKMLNEEGDEVIIKTLGEDGYGLYDPLAKEFYKPTFFPLLIAITTFNGYTLKNLRFDWVYLYAQKILMIWAEDKELSILGLIYDPYFDIEAKLKQLKVGDILAIDYSPFEESKMV